MKEIRIEKGLLKLQAEGKMSGSWVTRCFLENEVAFPGKIFFCPCVLGH